MKKLVVITGASSGIGMACAKHYAALGHPLLLLARRAHLMEALQLPNTLCRSVDVSNYDAVSAAINEAQLLYGPCDLLINNAGVMLLGKPGQQAYQEWETMIDTNVKGILTTTHAVLPGMLERNGGTIINISSIAGRKTFNDHAVYCSSKFAVHAMSEALRKEIADRDVRVIVVAPGVVETNLLSHTSDATIKENYNEWKQSIESGLDAQHIVDCIDFAYQMPQSVCVRELVIAKTKQED
ncbi:MAG: SDR family oxidoreductase [Erysipelotrichaceae bacterium]